MPPRRKRPSGAALSARFKEKATKAKRLGLHRHALVRNGRMAPDAVAELEETMWRYHQEGATNQELAAIFGYASEKSVYQALRRIREHKGSGGDKSSVGNSGIGGESEEIASEGTADDSKSPSAQPKEEPAQREFVTSFWAAFARRTLEKSTSIPLDGYSIRHMHLVRLEGEPDLGFEVEERETNNYIVTGVRDGGAASRAGMEEGNQVLMYSLYPMGRFEQRKLVAGIQSTFVPWVGESMLIINALQPNQAIVMKVHSNNGFSSRLNPRSKRIALGRTRIQNESASEAWKQSQRFDTFLTEFDTAMMDKAAASTTPTCDRPDSITLDTINVEEAAQADSDTGKHSMSSTETESDDDEVPAPVVQNSVPYCRKGVSRPRLKPRKHDKAPFSPELNKRDLYCVRSEGERTIGLDVREHERRFMISGVDTGGAASRAGLAVGQWLVSYKLYPVGPGNEAMPPSEYRKYEPWSHAACNALNRHPVNQAFIIKVVSPDGFTSECKQRMEALKSALQSIRGIPDQSRHRECLNKVIVQLDRQAQPVEAATVSVHARKSPSAVRDQSIAEPRQVDKSGEVAAFPTIDSPSDSILGAPGPNDPGEPDPKRRKRDAMCPSASASLQIEFFQAGQQLAYPCEASLTPEMVRSIKTSEFSVETVLFFMMKMAQFVSRKRLRVASPSFYHKTVLEVKFLEWEVFMVPNAPIVCLPVFDNGRWVLVVVVSTDSQVVVNYLDCQNPDGYVLPLCSRVTQFVEAAYSTVGPKREQSGPATPLVVSKAIPTARASDVKDSGVRLVSYFAAIIRALSSNDAGTTGDAQTVASASYERVFSRDKLHQEATASWMDALEPRICWGRRLADTWRPCLRLNLRKSTIDPSGSSAHFPSANDVAVIYLFDAQDEVQWLPRQELTALDIVKVDELADKMALTRDEVEALARFYAV